MHDDIVEFLKNHPEGVSSLDLANSILKMTNAPQTLADSMIKGILSKDCRCQQDNKGLWHVRTVAKSNNCKSFNELQFTAVFIAASSSESGKQICYLSLWDLIPEPHYKWGALLTDPNVLSACEQELIVGPDYQFNPDNVEAAVIRTANDLEKTIPIFLTSHDYNLLRLFCMNHGVCLTDDAMLASEFLKATEITIPKPMNMLTLKKAVFDSNTLPSGSYKQGEVFAECISELIRLMMERGITCREQMEELLVKDSSKFFVNKAYDYSLINSLPETPGVYGFQDKSGKYIYIGKAVNLKRRIESYFRSTEEFPKKLQQLHADSYSLTTVRCGSELECLILEYRLINKHSPNLNSKRKTIERKDSLPIDDSIVLLPHTDPEFIMSFWFRKNQKIQLKKISVTLENDAKLVEELEAFFFSSKPVSEQNFAEQEIAFRWIKAHSEFLTIIPVSKMTNAQELFESFQGYIHEVD